MVVGCDGVDGASNDMGHNQSARVNGIVVVLARDLLTTRRERLQSCVTGKVGGRAGRGFGQVLRPTLMEPGASEAKREDLVGIHQKSSPSSFVSLCASTFSLKNSPVRMRIPITIRMPPPMAMISA